MTPGLRCIIIVLVTVMAACGSRGGVADVPVPRRTAYPRIEVPDSVYRTVDTSAATLQINSAAADSTSAVDGWVTVIYPHRQATLYISVTRLDPATAATTIDNRIERLSMNTGGATTDVTSLMLPDDGGMEAMVLVTPAETPTPVQFLVTDRRTLMVSGTATIDGAADAPTDSLRPVIEMLRRDVTHLVKTLKRK